MRAAIHSPKLAQRWQQLGLFVRYETGLGELYSEFAILLCARRWNSPVEWGIHSRIAQEAGVSKDVISAILAGVPPVLNDDAQATVYDFARELLLYGSVSDASYAPALAHFGERGIVELTAIVGYYSMVAMMLNAHKVPLPEDERTMLEPSQTRELFEIPAR